MQSRYKRFLGYMLGAIIFTATTLAIKYVIEGELSWVAIIIWTFGGVLWVTLFGWTARLIQRRRTRADDLHTD